METIKQLIIDTIIKDGKDINELVSILEWSLKKAKELQDSQPVKGA